MQLINPESLRKLTQQAIRETEIAENSKRTKEVETVLKNLPDTLEKFAKTGNHSCSIYEFFGTQKFWSGNPAPTVAYDGESRYKVAQKIMYEIKNSGLNVELKPVGRRDCNGIYTWQVIVSWNKSE